MVSIIIPTYDKPMHLSMTLKSFSKQDIAKSEYEVIVIDDDSNVSIIDIIEQYKDIFQLQYIKVPKMGRAGARNMGIDIAKGNIIIFTDDDTIVEPNFIRQHKELHESNPNVIILGKRKRLYMKEEKIKTEYLNWIDCKTIIENNIIRDDSYETLTRKMFSFQSRKCLSSIPWICCVTANMSLKKKILVDVDKFDNRFKGWGIEDIELGYRLYQSGYTFLYYDNIINYHIEHHRKSTEMNKELLNNIHFFYEKYKDYNIILYLQFLKGEISLIDLVQKTQVSEKKSDISGMEQILNDKIRFFIYKN